MRDSTDDADSFSFRRRHIGRAVARAFWLFEEKIDERIRARFPDYRAADGQVIRCLPVDGARIVDLAERAKMTKQGMGKLVHSMEERGYLVRQADPADGRAQIVKLSRRGRALLRAAGTEIGRLEESWAEVIGQERLADVRAALLELTDALGPGDYL